MLVLWHFVIHWTGSDYGFGYGQFQPYDFLSGIAGLSIFGLLLAHIRKYNCEVKGCLRMARHDTAAGHHVCRRHHPDGPLTASDVHKHHWRALGHTEGPPP